MRRRHDQIMSTHARPHCHPAPLPSPRQSPTFCCVVLHSLHFLHFGRHSLEPVLVTAAVQPPADGGAASASASSASTVLDAFGGVTTASDRNLSGVHYSVAKVAGPALHIQILETIAEAEYKGGGGGGGYGRHPSAPAVAKVCKSRQVLGALR